jgi:Ni,Fe-hydrogenase III large subunit
MTRSLRLLATPSRDIPVLGLPDWRAELTSRALRGDRLVTLYGTRADGDDVILTAVFLDGAGALCAVRANASRHAGYHAVTEHLPAAHIFERELHEEFDLRVAGHPWLKPVRGTRGGHASPAAMDAYPYFSVDGKEVHEVAVGPIHAGVIEPGSFRFMCHGEDVHHLEIQLGYQHRGVEPLLLRGDPRRLAPLVETIAGDTSIAHAWAYSAAVEALASVVVDRPTELARGILLELERIAMHLAGLAGLAADVGFLQGATTYGRLRTTAINTSMLLCGSRFGRCAVVPGRARARLTTENVDKLRAAIALLREDTALVDELFLSSRTVQHRLRGVGELGFERAKEIGVVGMTARSSGLSIDVRGGAGGMYEAVPVEVCVETSCDCYARAHLRIREMRASLSWIERALEVLAPAPVLEKKRIDELAPSTLAVALVEGWRGEVVHVVETDGAGALRRYRAQDPSLRNWMGLALALRGNEISDFPICNKSFDLSYCGNDL